MFELHANKVATVRNDILSGLTVALALVPEAVAFAFVAGVEPLVGLYAAFMVGLITACIGGRPGMIDLIAVHNLQDWETHMATLKDWKEQGKVRYIGITTSHGRSHDEFIKVMKTEPIDFVQFSYNIMDRAAEESLFPVAQEQGIATMINRPYQRGSLFAKTRGKDLPDVAADIDVDSWGQFFLKFILAHPGVTSIIPATSKVHHMDDNMKANLGRVPDSDQREEMLRVFASL